MNSCQLFVVFHKNINLQTLVLMRLFNALDFKCLANAFGTALLRNPQIKSTLKKKAMQERLVCTA